MSTSAAIEAAPTSSTPINLYAKGVGGLLVVIGILGFIPGITTNYDQMGFFRTGAELFGLFATSVFSGSLFILFGLTVLAFSGSFRQAHKTVCWVGLTMFALGMAGAGMAHNSPSDLLPVNIASNWMHVVLGLVIMVGAGATRARHVAEHGAY